MMTTQSPGASAQATQPTVFQFQSIEVRTVDRDDQIWFVADDVAQALSYRTAKDMTRVLDVDEKGTHNMRTLGGDQQVTILSESGLYHALLKSRKPQARPFRRWVTEEVLPAIRRTGWYKAPSTKGDAESAPGSDGRTPIATPRCYMSLETIPEDITMKESHFEETDLEIARLLPIQTTNLDQADIPTVNARDLHAFLGVGKVFRTWIQDRIAKFGFVEGQDYVCTQGLSRPNLGGSKSRAQRTIEYHLTLDMAKELAMVERTAKGKEARRYFIACEKALLEERRKPRCGIPDIDPQEVERVARMARLTESYARNFRAMGMKMPGRRDAIVTAMFEHHGIDLRRFLPTPEAAPLQTPAVREYSDPAAFLKTLINAPLPKGGGVTKVGYAVYNAMMSEDPKDMEALARVGLGVKWRQGLPFLAVSACNPQLAALLRGTIWFRDGSWRTSLKNIPGIERKTAWLLGRAAKVYFVPCEAIPLDSLVSTTPP